MKNLFRENQSCNIMVAEQDPKKRNKNNTVKFLVNSSKEVGIGDVIIGSTYNQFSSCYEITEIISRKESNNIGKDFLEVKVKWEQKTIDYSQYLNH